MTSGACADGVVVVAIVGVDVAASEKKGAEETDADAASVSVGNRIPSCKTEAEAAPRSSSEAAASKGSDLLY